MNLLKSWRERDLRPREAGFVLLAILLAAALMRLPYADGRSSYDYNELLRDLAASASLPARGWVMAGPTCTASAYLMGPLYNIILYPLGALTGFALWSPAVTSLAFDLATMALLYATVRRWWGDRRLALFAVAVMALSNMDVQLAKYASNPNFVPFFTLLMMHGLERLLDRRSSWVWAAAAGGALAAGMQLHVVATVSLPLICLAVVARFPRMVTPQRLFGFAVAFLASFGIYLIFEASTGFRNVAMLLGSASVGERQAPYWYQLYSTLVFWISPVLSTHGYFDVFRVVGNQLIGWAALALCPVPFLINRDLRDLKAMNAVATTTRPSPIKYLLSVWLIVPSALLLLPFKSVKGMPYYYFASLMPLVYILMSIGWLTLLRRGLRRFAIYLLVVFVAVQLWEMWLYAKDFATVII